jgi:ribosome maturation factor RimP
MEVESMIRPVVESAGMELIEVDFRREAGRRVLRVTVDREPSEGGLDLDSISTVSERISRRLDVEGYDPPGGPYTLEVSSPGLERPLRRPRDYERRVGERVRIRTREPVDGSRVHVGTLVETGPDRVRVATERGDRVVSFEDIASARTVVEWGPTPKPGRMPAGRGGASRRAKGPKGPKGPKKGEVR